MPPAAVLASIKVRSWLANGTMFVTVLSKSKSKPSTTEVPKGRGELEPDWTGPKMDHILVAAVTAAAEEEKPPSVYVAPPKDSRIVFPYVD